MINYRLRNKIITIDVLDGGTLLATSKKHDIGPERVKQIVAAQVKKTHPIVFDICTRGVATFSIRTARRYKNIIINEFDGV